MRKQFYKMEKGHLGQYEDWWYFDVEKDIVTHSWDHVTVNGLASKTGEKSYSSKEFLDGDHHGKAKTALVNLMNN